MIFKRKEGGKNCITRRRRVRTRCFQSEGRRVGYSEKWRRRKKLGCLIVRVDCDLNDLIDSR